MEKSSTIPDENVCEFFDERFDLQHCRKVDTKKLRPDYQQLLSKNSQKIAYRTLLSKSKSTQERVAINIIYEYWINPDLKRQSDEPTQSNSIHLKISKSFTLNMFVILNELQLLKLCLCNSSNYLDGKDKAKRNLLYLASKCNYPEMVTYLLEQGSDIDEIQSNGSSALHASCFYGGLETVKILLDRGCSLEIKNDFGNFAKDEAITEKIRELVDTAKSDGIHCLTKLLRKEAKIGESVSRIKFFDIKDFKGDIVAKYIANAFAGPAKYSESVFHGTFMRSVESIFRLGLLIPGEKSLSGEEIKVNEGHIKAETIVSEIENWGKAIFVSPSPFYAGYRVYAEGIKSHGENYVVIIHANVKAGSYIKHKGNCNDYKLKRGEPEFLEYRITDSKFVEVRGLFLIKQKYLDGVAFTDLKDIFDFLKRSFPTPGLTS